jgi:hypothetical protein
VADTNKKARPGVPAKSIALPIEHGSWGFLFEPLVVGLVIAPSIAAIFISLLVVGTFLLRQPLKFLIGDMRQGRTLPRTAIARRFAVIFASIAAIGFLGTVLTAPLISLLPFAIVAPLAVYLIIQDAARQTRELVPEILAATVLSATPASMVVAAGGEWKLALALSAVMLARLIPSIVYIRNRLRLEKGKDYAKLAPIVVHVVAIAGVGLLAYYGLSPLLAVAILTLLLLRAVIGLSRYRHPVPAKVLGVWEVVYGVLTVLAVAIGYYAGL